MVDIIGMFISELPWSLLIIGIPAIAFYFLRPKGIERKLDDYVEIWLKGYSKTMVSAVVNDDMVQFTYKENEFNEPILTYPRIQLYRGKLVRTYHFAEGLTGTIDAPEPTETTKEDILEILLENGLIDSKKKETLLDDDDKFLEEIRFYNFDIDQGDIHAFQRTFNASVNTFPKLINDLSSGIKRPSEMTTFRIFLVLLVGVLLGLFMGTTLTYKGVL